MTWTENTLKVSSPFSSSDPSSISQSLDSISQVMHKEMGADTKAMSVTENEMQAESWIKNPEDHNLLCWL